MISQYLDFVSNKELKLPNYEENDILVYTKKTKKRLCVGFIRKSILSVKKPTARHATPASTCIPDFTDFLLIAIPAKRISANTDGKTAPGLE